MNDWLHNRGNRGARRLSFTYAPKLDAVRKGDCRQTIRLVDEVQVYPSPGAARANLIHDPVKDGTELIMYAWKGKPYRSKWEWSRYEKAKGCFQILFIPGYIRNLTLVRADGSEEMEVDVTGAQIVKLMVDENGLDFRRMYPNELTALAVDDGIPEPSITKLTTVLRGINHLSHLDWTLWDVIRW